MRTCQLTALGILVFLVTNTAHAQGYVSPFKYKDGNVVMKGKDEILAEQSQRAAAAKFKVEKEFEKPKKGYNAKGEYWIKGYCRYRPASYSTSNYNDKVDEKDYHREVFPAEAVIYTDDFKGGGTIPWAENAYSSESKTACEQLLSRLPSYVNDGLPFSAYDSLQKSSWYGSSKQAGSRKGREYEFSRAVSMLLKRKEGPENMFVTFTTRFPFVNSEDYLNLEFNDKGKYKISAFCDNCDDQYDEVASGTSKLWHTGDWNEVTVKKDEFNNILIYLNEDMIFQYRIPFVPIATHFAGFSLEMPKDWQKKKLQYNIGAVTSIHYPKAQ